MRKYIVQTIVFSLLFCSISIEKISAFESLLKYENNPLVFQGNLSDWNETGVLQNNVFIENNQFSMYYATYNGSQIKIASASSPDGYAWTRDTILDLQEAADYHDPYVLHAKNKKILFYATSSGGGNYRIKRAELINGIFSNKSDILAPQLNWETTTVSCPHVVYKNGTYYLFYCAAQGTTWNLGMATSADGISFTRCSDAPVLSNAGNTVFLERDNRSYLFLHSPTKTGIEVVESTDPLGCSMQWKNRRTVIARDTSYDANHIISPSLVEKDGKLWIYYTGLTSENQWKLNLATEDISPIIILPGFMGSWNKDAILHNKEVSYSDWKIPSFIKEYTGIVQTLKNIGYQENKDFFIFPYDWRKNIEQTAGDLNSFLNAKIWNANQSKTVRIVGHSLGGLAGRIFAQKYGTEKIKNLITVGSSHKGIVQVYKPLEAGEIDRENTFLWLLEKMILAVNKDANQTNKQIIQSKIPVLYNLFPTFDFLTKDNQAINTNTLSLQNNLLPTYNQTFSSIFPVFTSIVGEKNTETPAGYIVKDNVLYADGIPTQTVFEAGDYLVASKSSKEDSDYQILAADHTEIITEKDSIKKLLSLISVSYTDSQIAQGQKTTISPALIFLIKSPATMEVAIGENTYTEEDGIIFIPNAASGNYALNVKGTETGSYTVIIGQISETNDLWETVSGAITKNPPSSQTDTYSFQYNNQTAFSILPNPTPAPSPATAPTPTPTNTPTPTPTPTPTATPTPAPTSAPTPTLTPTPTSTPTSASSNSSNQNNSSSASNTNVSQPIQNPFISFFRETSVEFSPPEILGTKEAEIAPKEIKTPGRNMKNLLFTAIVIILISSAGFFFSKTHNRQH